MQCVSYDRIFADYIEDNFHRYPEMLREEKERKGKEKHHKGKTRPKTKQIPSSASPSVRKKARKQPESDSESDLETSTSHRQAFTASSSADGATPSSLAMSRPRRSVRSMWDPQTGSRVQIEQSSLLSPSSSEAIVADPDSDSDLSYV